MKNLSIALIHEPVVAEIKFFVELDGKRKEITREQYNIFRYLLIDLQVDISRYLQNETGEKPSDFFGDYIKRG